MTENNFDKVPPQLRDAVDAFVQQRSKGLGTRYKQQPVSVMLPPDLDAMVRALPNRSEFIRDAIREKFDRDRAEQQSESIAGSAELSKLEELRDRVLLTKPPRDHRKLKAALNAFIALMAEEK